MTRLEQIALVGAGALIGVLAIKAFEAPAAHAQSAGTPNISSSADGSRAWVAMPGGTVARCEVTGSYSAYVTCVTT